MWYRVTPHTHSHFIVAVFIVGVGVVSVLVSVIMCSGMHVTDREQLCGVSSLLPLSHRSHKSNSGPVQQAFYPLSHLADPLLYSYSCGMTVTFFFFFKKRLLGGCWASQVSRTLESSWAFLAALAKSGLPVTLTAKNKMHF